MMPFHSLTAAALVAVLLASAAAADADAQDQRTGWDGKGIAQNRGTNANTTVNRDDLRTFHEDSPLSMEDANFSLGDTMKSGSEIVTVELFPRAESDKVFSGYLSLAPNQTFNTFHHYREVNPIDDQKVPRVNRDTIYSQAILDLGTCSPEGVTLFFPSETMLDSRYASAMLVSQDHDILWTKYPSDAGKNGIQILPSDVPTDKLMLGLRIFTNGSESDLPNVHELQDAFRIEPIGGSNGDGSSNVSSVDNQNNNYNFTVAQRCKASAQNYITREAGRWDRDSLNSVAALLKELDKHSNSTKDEMFGPDWKTLNYLYYLFGVAVGWGGMEGKHATYIFGPPAGTDVSGKTSYVLTVPKDVPLRKDPETGNPIGFWSVSMYNESGFFEPNELGINSYNSATATKEADGSSKIAMASVDECKKLLEKQPDANCLPTTPEWNYAVRLYVPEEEVYNGSYSFPDPVPLA